MGNLLYEPVEREGTLDCLSANMMMRYPDPHLLKMFKLKGKIKLVMHIVELEKQFDLLKIQK